MLNIYYKTTKIKKQQKLKTIRDGAWIDIKKANKDDLRKITEITDLNYLDLKDSLDPHELPRIERVKDNIIIFVRSPKKHYHASDITRTDLLTIILTDKYFISISATENKIVKKIIKEKINIATTQRGNCWSIYY